MESNLELSQVYPMPRVGDMAPDFEAVTPKDPMKMSIFVKDKLYHNLL